MITSQNYKLFLQMDNLSPLVICRIEEVRNRFALLEGESIIFPGIRIFVNRIEAVAQNGPQCGLVAVKMAARVCKLKDIEVQQIYETAKSMNYTSQGEMFSASWISQLSLHLWPSVACSSVHSFPSPSEVVSAVQSSSALLIPYDCDRNHEPALRKGHAAHWCIVVGFVYIDSKSSDVCIQKESFEPVESDKLFVLAYHGKSKHMGVWNYETLKNSNAQLIEIGPTRTSEEFVLPEKGIEELIGKSVVIKNVSQLGSKLFSDYVSIR